MQHRVLPYTSLTVIPGWLGQYVWQNKFVSVSPNQLVASDAVQMKSSKSHKALRLGRAALDGLAVWQSSKAVIFVRSADMRLLQSRQTVHHLQPSQA